MANQSGQAVLIILLSMAIAVTVVLSVVASSTSDIKISTAETQSLRAFSAAEAGVEETLRASNASSGTVGSASFNANVTGLAQGGNTFIYPDDLVSGDEGFVWFVSHAADGSLTCSVGSPCFTGKTMKVCWGRPGLPANSSVTPAVELSTFYLSTPGTISTSSVARAVYDPNVSRTSTNSYSASDVGTCTIGQTQYSFQKQIDLGSLGIPLSSYSIQNGLQFMAVKMLYNTDSSQPFGIDVNFIGNTVLPSQGNQVDSTGTLNNSTRKIQVTSSYNQVPPIFDSAIYSPSAIIQ